MPCFRCSFDNFKKETIEGENTYTEHFLLDSNLGRLAPESMLLTTPLSPKRISTWAQRRGLESGLASFSNMPSKRGWAAARMEMTQEEQRLRDELSKGRQRTAVRTHGSQKPDAQLASELGMLMDLS